MSSPPLPPVANSCRLLTGATAALTGGGRAGGGEAGRRSTASTLLLTEYLAFVLDHRSSDDLRLAATAFALGACSISSLLLHLRVVRGMSFLLRLGGLLCDVIAAVYLRC